MNLLWLSSIIEALRMSSSLPSAIQWRAWELKSNCWVPLIGAPLFPADQEVLRKFAKTGKEVFNLGNFEFTFWHNEILIDNAIRRNAPTFGKFRVQWFTNGERRDWASCNLASLHAGQVEKIAAGNFPPISEFLWSLPVYRYRGLLGTAV